MKNKKIIGVVLLVLAGVLGYIGFSESQGIGSSLTSAIGGRPSDDVLIKYAGASILAVIGFIFLKK